MFARVALPTGLAFSTPAVRRFKMPRALANPFVGAGSAATGFVLLGALAITALGDPSAGAPSLRTPLAQAQIESGERIRRLLSPEDAFGAPTLDPLQFELGGIAGLGDGAAVGGQAVITLPAGGRTTAGVTVRNLASGATARRYPASPLAAAPIAGLVAASGTGPLPVIAADGRTPERAYARPFTANGKPKVALVIGGLGLNAAQTRAAIENLPPEVTLSFVPYADGLQGWIDQARAQGHEVMLEIPMEPLDYPENDPGPYTLLAQARPEETVKRLEWLLSRTTGYFGVTNYLGGKFLTSEPAVTPFLGALKARGLAFLDDGSGGAAGGSGSGVSRASADRIVDEQLSPDSIERQLLALEAAALQRGGALGAGFAYPVTVEQAARWAEGLPQRGYQLAPASAITRR
jgi:polysaccharide deacetylase 2 family uncharacterized protein YibQ